ncbi:TatD family hydrolase [Flavihumibacter solisilvae]|uniref:phosphotriesterase family protein n=1 Tax=Flavihumibacter solisilvae TaxID=1349421 RepID=UPI0009E19BFA|nr:TatD family hydrolase [Flavihumibacter solisilvae]
MQIFSIRKRTRHLNKLVHIILLFLLHDATAQSGYIMTVNGKLEPSDSLLVLPHEHVVTNFAGADKIVRIPYIPDPALNVVLPHLMKLKQSGINLLVECTPEFIGRDVTLLKKLSLESGVSIVTNTGFYAAAEKKYLPAYIPSLSAESIAYAWQNEFDNGIGGTDIRPGFIKLGVDKGPLDSTELKLLKAAIIVSRKTGLPIAVHSGDGVAAADELRYCISEGLAADKLIWVHAQNGTDEERKKLAEAGVWISLDGVNENNVAEYTKYVLYLKENSLLSRLLLSHDDGWSVDSNGSYDKLSLFKNGNSQPYQAIGEKLVPMLFTMGFTADELHQVRSVNPQKAFAIR